MYRCSLCNAVVPPHVPAQRIVLATRPRAYPFRREVNRKPAKHPNRRAAAVARALAQPEDRCEPKKDPRDDQGGRGREIVREALACPACAAACGYSRGRRGIYHHRPAP